MTASPLSKCIASSLYSGFWNFQCPSKDATPAVSHDLATPAGLHHHRHQLHRKSKQPFCSHIKCSLSLYSPSKG
ncbi:hypothetical protein BHM03_00033594 [Ensete ventricosum]|nr:hypothetical protein BHM03_00033594 [Ensete ventricosum]